MIRWCWSREQTIFTNFKEIVYMAKKEITFSQFCNFISKIGMHRFNAAKSIDKDIKSEYQMKMDYWGPLRSHISHVLSKSGKAADLDACIEHIAEEKKENYQSRIAGLKKFWGKKKFEKVRIPRRMWKHKDLRVSVYPELCFSYRDKVHIIKLFFSNDTKKITKNEADLLLEMMKETYKYDPNDVVYGILDLPKGRVFKYKNNPPEVSMLVQSEAEILLKILNQFDK